jgi:hypothetical protein
VLVELKTVVELNVIASLKIVVVEWKTASVATMRSTTTVPDA